MTLRSGLLVARARNRALRRLLVALALGTSGCLGASAPSDRGSRDDDLTSNPASLVAQAGQSPSTASERSFVAFESGQVRPLASSPDGKLLFAVNTPDNRLEVFSVDKNGRLKAAGVVPVGLEPVAVAARHNAEVWVVNHLSDSISVVNVSDMTRPRVVRTLLVGDEPRDIVFARDRAYVTTAHRGQNTGRDPQLTTPSVGRADVWVFNPNALGNTLAGTPLTVISLFADTPRALAVTPDGSTVYAAAFHSGNRTTVVPERLVTNHGGLPPPHTNAAGEPAPWAGLIVKYRSGAPDGRLHWLDELNRVWDDHLRFTLPDKDVFAIDATRAIPAPKPNVFNSGVGTVLFNMAVNPVNGKVYVSNLDSFNQVRFEGRNNFGRTGSVRGHLAESRISVLSGANVAARHLNKHINYAQDGNPAEAAKSLAFPTGMAVSKDGQWLYVAALGSSKLGVFRTAEIESNTFVPSASSQIVLSGGGPTGLVLNEAAKVAYVMTRFDNGISIVDTQNKREVSHVRMYNPEPASITKGRRFLYDAAFTSAHGDSACASCHIFGDLDSLAWDLGDPDNMTLPNPGPFAVENPAPGFLLSDFHSLKGPTTTQSLRGMANHGSMHWRGDRTGGNDVPASLQPDTGTFDEQAAFKKFNVAFPGLLGRANQLTAAEMQAFTDFILQVTYPPNPIRNLDNSLTAQQAEGRAFYFNTFEGEELPSDTFHNCNGCHTLDPAGNAQYGVMKPGFFGSDGRNTFDALPQFFKVPHLRNAYAKVGMFGEADVFGLPIDLPPGLPTIAAALPAPFNDVDFQGDQIRGFGFSHSGETDTVFRFVGQDVFAHRPIDDPFPNPGGIPLDEVGFETRRALEAFVLAFDSNLAPIVGQQVTLTASNAAVVNARIALLEQRAAAGECDLVVHGAADSVPLGFLYNPVSRKYLFNTKNTPPVPRADLRTVTCLTELTFTAVPVGSGRRIALDRDSDGVLDGNE